MKCDNCNKETENPLKIIEINIKPELFLNKFFCNESCIHQLIKKKIKPEELRGITILYKTSQEV